MIATDKGKFALIKDRAPSWGGGGGKTKAVHLKFARNPRGEEKRVKKREKKSTIRSLGGKTTSKELEDNRQSCGGADLDHGPPSKGGVTYWSRRGD